VYTSRCLVWLCTWHNIQYLTGKVRCTHIKELCNALESYALHICWYLLRCTWYGNTRKVYLLKPFLRNRRQFVSNSHKQSNYNLITISTRASCYNCFRLTQPCRLLSVIITLYINSMDTRMQRSDTHSIKAPLIINVILNGSSICILTGTYT
jgi:hypothetical protein